ncbi:hypothetical protein BZL30_8538 [Mycobacterium kansasii]|uniref:Uncharacterized protein n=1 Tax=Mycobacterium kansasii TaxID=1768 RepID=A0A1V3WF13_MYCKA|nr:hypothetical protein BZL30_8538 [Mycobacterium kansasii]
MHIRSRGSTLDVVGAAAYAVLADLAGDAIVVADPPKTVGHRAIG